MPSMFIRRACYEIYICLDKTLFCSFAHSFVYSFIPFILFGACFLWVIVVEIFIRFGFFQQNVQEL